MSDLHHMTVRELLQNFHTGELSPLDVVKHYVARIKKFDPDINCVIDVFEDSALATAAQAEQEYRASTVAGTNPRATKPLLGVPFLLKEQHDLKGHSATRGSGLRAGMVAKSNHPIVQRLLDAGAIALGRTTTPEFSCATFSQTTQWGVSRNPFNTAKTPGGSSGGSGGAVAAGFAPFATASDIAGSTRIPAAFNGLPGFKTPYGATPGVHPLNADWYRGDHILARTVADTAMLTDVITGVDPYDHSTVPVENYASLVPTKPNVRGLRVAVSYDLGIYELDPSVRTGIERVADALRTAGAQVDVIDLKLDAQTVHTASMAHFGHLIADNIHKASGGDPTKLEPYTALFMQLAKAQAQNVSLLDSIALEQRIQGTLAIAMTGYDVLVTGTSAIEDLDADNFYLDGVDRPGGHVDFYWQAHMTVPFNIANRCPVMAFPSGIGSQAVPTSVQIVGHPYTSAPVWAVAAQLEADLPLPKPQIFTASA